MYSLVDDFKGFSLILRQFNLASARQGSGIVARYGLFRPNIFTTTEGTPLFKQIRQVPEYYLSDCEAEIRSQQARDLAQAIAAEGAEFD